MLCEIHEHETKLTRKIQTRNTKFLGRTKVLVDERNGDMFRKSLEVNQKGLGVKKLRNVDETRTYRSECAPLPRQHIIDFSAFKSNLPNELRE